MIRSVSLFSAFSLVLVLGCKGESETRSHVGEVTIDVRGMTKVLGIA